MRLYLAEKRDDLMLVPPVVRECVVFLCFNTENGRHLAGTGFFLAKLLGDGIHSAGYLVTARHVIETIIKDSSDGLALVRLNLKAGGSELIETQSSDWTFHPSEENVDVACISFTLAEKHRARVWPDTLLLTNELIKKFQIGPGDELFFPGLFVNHFGRSHNLPIVRIGNIAAMPEERVDTHLYGPIDAFLAEARSIGGLSGSPVFAHLIPGRNLGGEIQITSEVFLLGLMHGHYDSPLTKVDALADTSDEEIPERVNMGIAIVVPSWKIDEVLNHPRLAFLREMDDEILRSQRSPTPD